MSQLTFLDGQDLKAQTIHHDGETYNPELDGPRLKGQQKRVYQALKDGKWRTLAEIAYEIFIATRIDDPEASISARIRDFRKSKFGGLVLEKRRRGDAKRGLWEYRIKGGDQA